LIIIELLLFYNLHFGTQSPIWYIYMQHVSRTCVWRQLNSVVRLFRKIWNLAPGEYTLGYAMIYCWQRYTRTFKQRPYLFYKIMLVLVNAFIFLVAIFTPVCGSFAWRIANESFYSHAAYHRIGRDMYRVSTSRKYFRNAETGCPSDAVRARERSLRKHFRPFQTRLSALRPRRTRALDGCIDHPKCKLPTQKYNSHCRYSSHTPKHDISKCNVKIATSLIVFVRVY